MTTLQITLLGAALVAAVGTGIYEARIASSARNQVRMLQEQQRPLVEQIQELQREHDDATNRLAMLSYEHERLNRNSADLLKLRSEVVSLRKKSERLALDRVKLIKQRFEQWPGKKTPELQLLREQDWLDEVGDRKLDSDAACREAMGHLRWIAKGKFAMAIKDALEQFAKSNDEQLPSNPSQLAPYLTQAAVSCLEGYEIPNPGSVFPPIPDGSKSVKTWAMVEKGTFAPNGMPANDGSGLSDPAYDLCVVIHRGGHYGYAMGKRD